MALGIATATPSAEGAVASRHAGMAVRGEGTAPHLASLALEPNDALPRPGWWNGPCDSGDNTVSYKLAASFDGLQDCGPGSNQSGEDFLVRFFPGAWGEFEWECVELSMRWMDMAWGAAPYPANGNQVVTSYPNGTSGYPSVTIVPNGAANQSPQPGDVLSLDNANPNGHTEVVTAASVDGNGNGELTAMTENDPPGASGWTALKVSDWVVSDGVRGDRVIGWLHNPAWSLQLPVAWQVTTAGDLEIADSGMLRGGFATVATGVAKAEVIGGDGWEPEPIVVALTTAGELEAGYYLPGIRGRKLAPIASDVTAFTVSAGPGTGGKVLLGWLTKKGNFEVSVGGFLRKPVREATRAAAVAIAPNSGESGPFLAYLSTTGTFFTKHGSGALWARTPWVRVATNVMSIAIAGGDQSASDAIEGYLSKGTFYERQGLAGAFTREANGVSQIAVASIGPAGTPLSAYISAAKAPEAHLEVAVGTGSAFFQQASGVKSMSLAASNATSGFPIVGAITASGEFEAEEGDMNGHFTEESTGASAAGVAALTVS
jgi:hypothetical protein